MNARIYSFLPVAIFLILASAVNAQRVGVLTPNPQGPFHVASSGQVNTEGGLVILGDTSEAHLEMDFNLVQSMYADGPLRLELQPHGGDLRVGTNLLHLNSTSGFLGIGTVTPARKLDVQGSGDQFARVHTTSAGTSTAGLELIRSTEFSATDWRILNEGGSLRIYDGTDNFLTTGDLNFHMGTSGSVGLGTDSPESHLHIAGSTDQILKIHRTTDGSGMAGLDLLRAAATGTDYRIVNNGGVLQFRDAADNFAGGGGDVNMIMSPNGNVGVGTESPHTVLHVDGSEDINETGDGYFQVGNGTGLHVRHDNNEILARNGDSPSSLFLQYWSGNLLVCNNDNGRMGLGTSSPAAKLHITDGTDVNLSSGGQLVLGPTNSENLAFDGNEILARNNGNAAPLSLQVSGGDVMLIPFENGQVGIGITDTANLPSPEYLLAVDGRIISEEVRVELSGSWPDYVFADDYELMPLQKLEEAIDEKGHLPGIPSAASVENDGLLLGDMQRAMMEKIEELTLYVIDLQKQIEELKKERNRLR